ncbi:hypothetical protein AAHB63_17520 [Bacillus thuringiensis]
MKSRFATAPYATYCIESFFQKLSLTLAPMSSGVNPRPPDKTNCISVVEYANLLGAAVQIKLLDS